MQHSTVYCNIQHSGQRPMEYLCQQCAPWQRTMTLTCNFRIQKFWQLQRQLSFVIWQHWHWRAISRNINSGSNSGKCHCVIIWVWQRWHWQSNFDSIQSCTLHNLVSILQDGSHASMSRFLVLIFSNSVWRNDSSGIFRCLDCPPGFLWYDMVAPDKQQNIPCAIKYIVQIAFSWHVVNMTGVAWGIRWGIL